MNLFGRKKHASPSVFPPAAPVTPRVTGADLEVGKVEAGVAASPAAICPYCAVELVPPPKASKRCPHCGQKIHRRTVPGTDERRLMTEAEAAQNDTAWERYRACNESVRIAEQLGFSRSDFERARRGLASRWGHEPPPHDVLWRLLNRGLLQAGERGDLLKQSAIYGEQAHLLYQEEGSPYLDLARKAAQLRLQYEASRDPTRPLHVYSANDSHVCPSCRALANRRRGWTVAEALEDPPVPNPKCASGWCRCSLG
jgi:hypothetical protein